MRYKQRLPLYIYIFFFFFNIWVFCCLAPFVEKSILSPLTYFYTVVKINFYYLFLKSLFCSIDLFKCSFINTELSCLLQHYEKCLKSKTSPPTLFLFFKIVLAPLVPLLFIKIQNHIVSISNSNNKNLARIFIAIVLYLQIRFGEI